MKILAVDDERVALNSLVSALHGAGPELEIYPFQQAKAALDFAQTAECEAAFLDIEMPDMNGLELAVQLQKLNPRINLIFVTGHPQYTAYALSIYVSGYVLKPATVKNIARELEHLRFPPLPSHRKRMQVCTAGGCFVSVDGKPLRLARSQTRELLTVLLRCRGVAVSERALCAALWGNLSGSADVRGKLRILLSDLRRSFSAVRLGDLLVKDADSYFLRTDQIEFIEEIPTAECGRTGDTPGPPPCLRQKQTDAVIIPLIGMNSNEP